MSRSVKLPIIKDRGLTTQEYWSKIRREWKQTLHKYHLDEDLYLRNPKSIVNDYDKCDYIINYEYNNKNRNFWLNGISIKETKWLIKSTRK